MSRGAALARAPGRSARWPARAAALAWCLAMALPVLVTLVSPQGFQAVLILAGLLAAPAALAGRGRGTRLPGALAGTLAALLAWSALALAWTGDVGRAAPLVGAAFGTVLAALALCYALPRRDLALARAALVWGLGLAIGLGVVDLLTQGAVQTLTRPGLVWWNFEVNRPSALATLFVWPALFAARTTVGRATLLAGAAALAALSVSEAAVLALAAGAVALGMTRLSRRATAAIVLLVPLGILATPWIALHLDALVPEAATRLLPSVTGLIRLQIWQNAAELWQTAPLHGLGIEAIRAAVLPDIAWQYAEMRVSHPHNAFLQAALDLGLVGNAALAGLVFALANLGARARLAPLHMAALAASAGVLATSWSLWATWWIAALAALVLACALVERESPASRPAAP